MVDGDRDPAADEVAEPAVGPEPGDFTPAPRLVDAQHADGEVVAGEEFAAGRDHHREGGGEGDRRADLRGGSHQRGQIAADRHGDHAAEGDEHACNGRGHEIAQRIGFHEPQLRLCALENGVY